MSTLCVPKLERSLGKHKYDIAIQEMKERGLSSIRIYKWYGSQGDGHGGFTSYIDRVEDTYVERREYFDGHVKHMAT